MSNVIKGYAVRYDNPVRKLDYNERCDKIQKEFLENSGRLLSANGEKEQDGDGFLAGISAVRLTVEEDGTRDFTGTAEEAEAYRDKIQAEAERKVQEMLLDAEQEAQGIRSAAKMQADKEKKKVFDKAKEDGYQEGIRKGEREISGLRAELEEEKKAFYQEQERILRDMEPQVAALVIDLIHRLTGILLTDREEIIFYLVRRAFTDAGPCTAMIIKASKEDYPYLVSRKEELAACLAEGARLEIVENPLFAKTQCQIDTDSRIIDLSLDVQLKNLTESIKMLSL